VIKEVLVTTWLGKEVMKNVLVMIKKGGGEEK
jgi:hypothetical protein